MLVAFRFTSTTSMRVIHSAEYISNQNFIKIFQAKEAESNVRVHCYSAHAWPPSKIPRSPGLAETPILPIGIAHTPDSSRATTQNVTYFATLKFHLSVLSPLPCIGILRYDSGEGSSGAHKDCASIWVQRYGVNQRSRGDYAQWENVAWADDERTQYTNGKLSGFVVAVRGRFLVCCQFQ